jgi:RimJ/RimL family protein N-acetyltransferase
MKPFYFKEIASKSGQHVRFRPEERNDLDGVWTLYSSLSEESQESLPPFDRQLIERWSENLSQYTFPPILATVLTSRNGERVIGRAVLVHSDRPSVRHRAEFGIVVRDEYQDQGIGTELTRFMLEIACRHGLMKVTLEVFPDNERAIHVYERCGFLREGLLTEHYIFHGRFYDAVLMSYNCRKLTPPLKLY